MDITAGELGRRLREARETAELTQDDAAAAIGLTRGAVAQIEGGMRAPNSLQLVRLAGLYAREPGDFLTGVFDPADADPLVSLFRADQLTADPVRTEVVRACLELSRRYDELEELLGSDRGTNFPVRYDVPQPRSRWEAVRQGEAIAESERGRLGLGGEPAHSLVDLLQSQGIKLALLGLPDDVSGLSVFHPRFGLAIFINEEHHFRRQRFSYAHEYCHVLADRDLQSYVSKDDNRTDLREVRANAFAASFLLPTHGVQSFLASFGKDASGRTVRIFDDEQVITARGKAPTEPQTLGANDVADLAAAFGVSYDAALYRLQNLGHLTDDQRARLAGQQELTRVLHQIRNELQEPQGPSFHRRLLSLAVDAYQASLISGGRFREICHEAKMSSDDIDRLLFDLEDAGPQLVEA
ncbi:MAG: ImmA/IrrE family metallo-endopeptidase [Chloroflexi bacterium]|nr:ImmA/IrrE family metallo-endopeptidase [Chloroflexota bacterium]